MDRRDFFRGACGLGALISTGCNSATALEPQSGSGGSAADSRLENGGGTVEVTPAGEVLAVPTAGQHLVVRGSDDVITGILVENDIPGSHVQAEVRVSNGVGGGDFWISGQGYSDGSNWAPNEVGIVAESRSAGMHLRSNGDTYIRFSVGQRPVEYLRLTSDGLRLAGRIPAGQEDPGPGGTLFVENGVLKWLGANGTMTSIAPA